MDKVEDINKEEIGTSTPPKRYKKIVYTCIFGDYDTLKDPIVVAPGWDYICVTDDPKLTSDVWEIRKVETKEEENLAKKSRAYKVNPWRISEKFEFALWVDASIQIVDDVNMFTIPLISNDFATTPSNTRESVYEEAKKCIKNKIESEEVEKQMNFYYSRHPGIIHEQVYDNDILFWSNNEDSKNLSTKWLEQLTVFSSRDQLSLPMILPQSSVRVGKIDIAFKQKYFTKIGHKSKDNVRVYYFTPYDSDKNLGKAINDHCELVQDDDWICIMDRDTMFLTPDYGSIIEAAIKRYPETDLFGCITNRLGLHWQVHDMISSDDPDIRNHMTIAKERADKYGEYSTVTDRYIAGLFLLFKKSTWNKLKFREGLVHDLAFIDYYFSQGILNAGGTIRLIEGLYVYHNYRLKEEDNGFEHLRTDKEEGYELDTSKLKSVDELVAIMDVMGIRLSEKAYNRLGKDLKHYFK